MSLKKIGFLVAICCVGFMEAASATEPAPQSCSSLPTYEEILFCYDAACWAGMGAAALRGCLPGQSSSIQCNLFLMEALLPCSEAHRMRVRNSGLNNGEAPTNFGSSRN